jgi:hypothetical protein
VVKLKKQRGFNMSTFLHSLVDGKPNKILVEAIDVQTYLNNGYCFTAEELEKPKKKASKAKVTKTPIEE